MVAALNPQAGLVTQIGEVAGARASAVLSPDQAYRYVLGRSWASPPFAIWVMLNPSTADAFTDDATIRRCRGFATRWGFGGIMVVNAYALRATDPSELDGHPDPVGPDNDELISSVLGEFGRRDLEHQVVVAWGATPILRNGRDTAVIGLIQRAGLRPACLGLTRAGYPKHPVRLAGDTARLPYRHQDLELARSAPRRTAALRG